MSRRPVLVVDDDPEIREMTALLLGGAGHRVETAGSGEEGLAMARELRPAVVLLDINMPGMDGWETLRLLKEDEQTAAIPVVMFSIRFELREKLHALQHGAADYVTKPFDVEGLLERIDDLIRAPAEGSA